MRIKVLILCLYLNLFNSIQNRNSADVLNFFFSSRSMENNTKVVYKYTQVAGHDRIDAALPPRAGSADESEDESEGKEHISSIMVSEASRGVVGDSSSTSRKFLYLAACIGE